MRSTLRTSSRVWHLACIMVGVLALLPLSGCFYVVPVPWADPHPSPQKKSVSPDPDTAALLTATSQNAFVVVVDDDDTVSFIWTLSSDGYVGTATPVANEGTIQGSQVKLPYDPNLDGQTLTCVVSDGLSDDITYRWQLEVL